MVYLVVPDKAILDEIGYTPGIDGGIGPVRIVEPVESEDGRHMVAHPWSEVDCDWLEAYVSDIPGCLVTDALPADFVPKIRTAGVDGVTIVDSLPEDWGVSADEQPAG